MLIFIQCSLFGSQVGLLSTRVLRRRSQCVNSPIWMRESLAQHPPTRPPWFIDIALKLGAQLSIPIAIFQVFGITRLWIELTTSRFGGERSTILLPVGVLSVYCSTEK